MDRHPEACGANRFGQFSCCGGCQRRPATTLVGGGGPDAECEVGAYRDSSIANEIARSRASAIFTAADAARGAPTIGATATRTSSASWAVKPASTDGPT